MKALASGNGAGGVFHRELDDLIAELEKAEEVYQRQVDEAAVAARKLEGVRAALAALRGGSTSTAHAEPPAKRRGAHRKAKPERIPSTKRPRSPKASKAKRPAAKAKPSAKPKRVAPDEPRVAKGRLPTVGVEQLVCGGEDQRRAKVNELRDAGYLRVGPGHPLTPGCYDVRDTPDGAVVIWRPKAEGGE